jgi:ferritin-like metal-binding protein YciE
MKIETLPDLLVHQLKDLHSAEKMILKALPRMREKASHEELKSLLQSHEAETRSQLERLETAFEMLDASPGGQTCEAMAALIVEGELLMRHAKDPDVMDAAIIAAAQKVEHYEMASYGCARTYAQMQRYAEVVQLLQATLDEEKDADARLTRIAEGIVNVDASRARS